MDLLVLNAITQELQDILITAKIIGSYQPADLLLILLMKQQENTYRLLISADPNYPGIYLTSQDFKLKTLNSELKLNFGKSLKHHLQGGQIEWISKPPLERIVHIDISKKELDGNKTTLRLIAEIMGRHSNIILVDAATGKVLDSIKHVTASMTSYRRIVPGVLYAPPPEQKKLNPLTLTKEEFTKILAAKPRVSDSADEKPLWQYILDTFQGFSPLTAKEITAYEGWKTEVKSETEDLDALWKAFERITGALKSGPYAPVIITLPGDPGKKSRSYLSPIRLAQFGSDHTQIQVFDSILQAADSYYSHTLLQQQLEVLRSSLLQIIAQRLIKNEKKQRHLEEEIASSGKAEELKKLGELLTANLTGLKKGITEVEVVDFYDPDQKKIKIKLDSRWTPSQNAQKYFSQYAKLKRSIPIAQERLESVKGEIIYLKELQFFIEEATSLEELKNLEKEVKEKREDQGRKAKAKGERRKAKGGDKKISAREGKPFRRFLSSEGFPIWVGRSSQENDLLTFKFSISEDLWLHARGVAGSHVLVLNRTRSKFIPQKTLEEAAALAAYYSKGRGLGKVPVDYTLKKYVRKPKGSPPGLVTLTKHETILVKPRKEVMRDER